MSTLALREDGDRLDVERAAEWIRGCKDLTELQKIRDKARALEVYQRSRAAALDAQQDAAEIALRAERRLGELCRTAIRRGGDRKSKSRDATLNLDDLGISKSQSSRWQKLAAVPEEDFDAHVQVVREKGERLTTAGTIRATSDADDYDGDEWGTPLGIIEAAREVLGAIDLDPASNDRAQGIVQADRYYTKEDNGLAQPWAGRVWMNPPYSKPLVSLFCERFIELAEAGEITDGMVLVNNATDTKWCQELLRRFPVCFPPRISFLGPHNKPVHGTRQGQALFYAGENLDAFASRFEQLGAIQVPWGWWEA